MQLSRIGLVVHPTRDIDQPLSEVRGWCGEQDVELVQLATRAGEQQVAREGQADDCDLILSIGGDGTMLAAVRSAAAARRPVLGVACGSLGVLTATDGAAVREALERLSRDEWEARQLPALELEREGADTMIAFNDVVVVRAGEGQMRVRASVDGALFAQIAGDGCIVSTPIGSAAYAVAAGGPLLAPYLGAFLLTPLPSHGGSAPPLVLGADSELSLEAAPGHGGGRLEVDGQVAASELGLLTIRLRRDVVTVVRFDGDDPFLTRLRNRGIIADSPRFAAERK